MCIGPKSSKMIQRNSMIFIQSPDSNNSHCAMEATGNYYFLQLCLLDKAGIWASLINPKQIKHFARMVKAVIKTDDVDAKMIVMYGEKM